MHAQKTLVYNHSTIEQTIKHQQHLSVDRGKLPKKYFNVLIDSFQPFVAFNCHRKNKNAKSIKANKD